MKRALLVFAAALVVLLAVLLFRAASLTSRQISAETGAVAAIPAEGAAARRAASHLAEAIRIETISHQDPEALPVEAFRRFHAWLARTYPGMHAALRRETFSDWSLLYTWPGRNPALEPALFLAHYDVVPIADASKWSHPPFSGAIADGFVWGRGALDDKGAVIALCETAERLLAEGFTPERSVIFAFGHDEEVGGRLGAQVMARTLAERGVTAAFVLDEGLAVAKGVLPGFDRPLALVGIAEKGYVTLELTVEAPGGHSSTPPRHTAVGILAAALVKVEANPVPGGVRGAARTLFEYLAPELPFLYRVPLANLWLFGGALERALGGNPGMNALLRTTTAATMLEGSPKENVIPSRAVGRVNFRILPGDTSESVTAYIRSVVNDERVRITDTVKTREPSAISPIDGPAFALLQRTVAETLPEAIFAPGLTVAGTDSRHYAPVTDRIYRFVPFTFGPEDLGRAHGIDERLAVANLAQGIAFYDRLFRQLDFADPD